MSVAEIHAGAGENAYPDILAKNKRARNTIRTRMMYYINPSALLLQIHHLLHLYLIVGLKPIEVDPS